MCIYTKVWLLVLTFCWFCAFFRSAVFKFQGGGGFGYFRSVDLTKYVQFQGGVGFRSLGEVGLTLVALTPTYASFSLLKDTYVLHRKRNFISFFFLLLCLHLFRGKKQKNQKQSWIRKITNVDVIARKEKKEHHVFKTLRKMNNTMKLNIGQLRVLANKLYVYIYIQ